MEILQSQVAEHAQTKVESASRMPLKILGTVHSTVAANSGEANWLENPNIVAAAPPRTGSFTLDATNPTRTSGLKASRLARGKAVARSSSISLEVFLPFQTGHVMGFRDLVYAFARFERGDTALQVGQDEMMLAPRNPTSVAALSFPLLFRSGNLYLRTPQARVERRLAGSDSGELRVAFGIVAPIGGDYRVPDYTFVPPALGGERSRYPGVAGTRRLAARRQRSRRVTWSCRATTVASDRVDVLADESRSGRRLSRPGRALWTRRRGVRWRQPRCLWWRAWTGFGVGGGFLEARVKPLDRWEVVFGGGTDRPEDPVPLTRNNSAYSSLTFRPTPEVATSFEYRWLETSAGVQRRRNHHFNWAVAYSF